MFKRRVAVLLPMMAIVLGACTTTPGASGQPTGSGGKACKVGVSWNNYQQPRWAKADEPAIKAAVAAAGGTYVSTDAQDKEDQQLTDIDNLISQDVDVLIVLAKDNVAILPAIQKAKDEGIPVIGYDRLIADESVFYITFDNQGVGKAMTEVMLEEVPEGVYVVIKGHQADPNADFLREGMDQAGLKEKVDAGDIDIIFEEYTDTWRTEAAQENMEAALAEAESQNKEIDAVLSENDSMAIGIVAALDAEGLAGTIPVSGQDGDEANLNNVAKGFQLVDVWKDAFGLGETAGNVAIQLCNGTALNAVKAPDTLKPHVKPDNLAAQPFQADGKTVQSIILKPTPVTQENLDVPIDLGWVSKETVCAGAEAGVAACQ
jgi:D-xylose transport system substrate-binding protein